MGNTDLSSLTNILHDMLNKEHKNKKVAYFLDDDIYTPTDVGNWLHTGSSVLDLAISNIPNGGVPYGRITELQGLEGSGKSLIGAHLLASNQKQGGISIYIDTETAVFRPFLEVIGVGLKIFLRQ
jgi:RecA/RadA recombinase